MIQRKTSVNRISFDVKETRHNTTKHRAAESMRQRGTMRNV